MNEYEFLPELTENEEPLKLKNQKTMTKKPMPCLSFQNNIISLKFIFKTTCLDL